MDLTNRGEHADHQGQGPGTRPPLGHDLSTVPQASLLSGAAPVASSSVTSYQPKPVCYGWTVGQKQQRGPPPRTDFLWLGIVTLADPVLYGTPVVEAISQPKLVDAGPYFYSMRRTHGVLHVQNPSDAFQSDVSGGWSSTVLGHDDYYTQQVVETGTEYLHHTIEADRAVAIRFWSG